MTREHATCHAVGVSDTVSTVSRGTTSISTRAAPLPLFVVFGLFVAAIVYLVASSLMRRTAPVYTISPRERVRAANWETAGDTLTIDATDGDHWQYVSLMRGQVLTPPDTSGWDIAVQRYRVRTPPGTEISDLGPVPFELPPVSPASLSTTHPRVPSNAGIEHWYRYNLLTHLLEPNGHLFLARSPNAAWRLAVVSYYCPKLVAGCLTIRYAPFGRGGSP